MSANRRRLRTMMYQGTKRQMDGDGYSPCLLAWLALVGEGRRGRPI